MSLEPVSYTHLDVYKRQDRNSPFVYTLENGYPLALGQGNRYVCIMSPRSSTLNYE